MNETALIERLLIVDDDEFILKTTAFILRRLGYREVLIANRAAQGLTLLDNPAEPVDVVLCDLNMPEMDGVEFLRRLAEADFAGGVILFSGEDARTLKTAENLAKARHLNVLGTLTKPVRVEMFTALVADWRGPLARQAPLVSPPVDPVALRAAIDLGELVPYFQPKVDLSTGEVLGVEILARWRSPSLGLVYPDAFIPVAEAHGLIDDLSLHLLQAALAEAADWQRQGVALKLAFNISMQSLNDPGFPNRLLELIEQSTIPTSHLVLEVTESRLMQDPVRPLAALIRLRLKKIRLSIDDFGTGYSSLSQLHDLPFDELKIDRGFVQKAGDACACAILEASVSMGQRLGMTLVAEGIETEQDWRHVAKLGCEQGQGYFIAKPMPGAAIPAWLKDWRARLPILSLDGSRL